MIKFDISQIFAENSVNSVKCFFWAAQIWNSSKNAHIKNQVLEDSKNLTPNYKDVNVNILRYVIYRLSPYHLPPSSPGVL